MLIAHLKNEMLNILGADHNVSMTKIIKMGPIFILIMSKFAKREETN